MEHLPDIAGVLFDIDDTLVDLETAMGRTLHHVGADTLAHLSDADWTEYKRLYAHDPLGSYDRFLAGELTFTEQRLDRVRHAQAAFVEEPLEGEAARHWNTAYEATLPLHFAPYDDVVPLLDALESRRIPYGAVSNNVHDYQRAKLNRSGLSRFEVLVGIDTVGVAKPDPAIYLEGARQLGTLPERTLYVGDNRVVDAEGADAAGLIGVWLDRRDAGTGDFTGRRITSLAGVLQLLPHIR
ncbi:MULTISPECIES: HAD family hydrolase [unclassified Arthrobacter]|uniref:HAD family hydrolase n=1 Tax=unclassified Arthrobacter TaxID=235627 RepID=UPI000301FDC5|nr:MULTISPECIES: HAD family hydrolase [unclassified Arthrobacter]PVE15065.1 HAD family hydrolase [Arthrobacter sp. Bz4]